MNSTSNLPRISIVIPNHGGAAYLERCLKSLAAQACPEMEIVVVDNASRDRSAECTRAVAPEAILLQQDRNLGFAGGANAGIRAAQGEWVAVLNNDTEVASGWLSACMRAIQDHPEASFFACRILDFNHRGWIYSAGDCFLRAGLGYRRGQEQEDREGFRKEMPIFSACGCAALYRRSVLKELGGFDERFFAYLEDVDLGLRLQAAGHCGYYVPSAEVYHHGAATSGGEFSPLSVRLRTRNALLLPLKSLPVRILFRCLPMIITAQLSWLYRAAVHGKLVSYIRGLGGALLLAPAVIRDRAVIRPHWRRAGRQLWQSILRSENLARDDFVLPRAESASWFLKWYFRFFNGGSKEGAPGLSGKELV
jgi:GT2 family glycosyltransferase